MRSLTEAWVTLVCIMLKNGRAYFKILRSSSHFSTLYMKGLMENGYKKGKTTNTSKELKSCVLGYL